jgi:hypothetical protein
MEFEGEYTSYPQWFPVVLLGIGLASLALFQLFW